MVVVEKAMARNKIKMAVVFPTIQEKEEFFQGEKRSGEKISLRQLFEERMAAEPSANVVRRFYLPRRHDRVLNIIATSTHAYVVSEYRGVKEIQRCTFNDEGVYTDDDWTHREITPPDYLTCCAFESRICAIFKDRFVLLDENLSITSVVALEITAVHTCTMNRFFIYIATPSTKDESSTLKIYSWSSSGVCELPAIVAKYTDTLLLHIECVDSSLGNFIVCTDNGNVVHHKLTYNKERERWHLQRCEPWHLFYGEEADVQMSRDFSSQNVVVAASDSRLAFAFHENGRISVRNLNLYGGAILDVHRISTGVFAVHDSNNNLFFIASDATLKRTIPEIKVLAPYRETCVRVPRTYTPYTSMYSSINEMGEHLLTTVLTTGDLCVGRI